VARDLSAADTSQINLERVKGFITDLGGKTSHTGIIAQTLEIPLGTVMSRLNYARTRLLESLKPYLSEEA
jgi:phosphoenolpyruvate-protein kinase (PTS system EI component)